jgi:hypothetical protein
LAAQGNKENAGIACADACGKAAAPPEKQSAAANAHGGSVSLQQVKKHVTCGICSGYLASSLVLSCGHIFCGSCLFE